ncbi:MAG: GAF domain-containing protein, partial [Ktedonobacterales bacterium]|nr:GAF domain-containing protein [Ktedonobacterales bacterium]
MDETSTVMSAVRAPLEATALATLGEANTEGRAAVQVLLDLSMQAVQPTDLDQIEAEGRHLAMTRERFDQRLAALEDALFALEEAVTTCLDDATVQHATHMTLHTAYRTVITTLARGFQAGGDALARAESARAQLEQRRLRAVQRINTVANSTMNIGEMLETAAKIIADELPIDLCAIFLYDNQNDELTLDAISASPDEVAGHFIIHLGDQITGVVAQRAVPDGVPNLHDWTIPPIETQMFGREYQGVYVMPIICFGGESSILEGAITLLKRATLVLSAEEFAFLELVAGQLALSMENSKIYRHAEETRLRQMSNIAMLQSVSATVATSFDLVRVLQMIISQAVQISGSTAGAIFLLENDGALRIASRSEMNAPSLRDTSLRVGQCCVGHAAEGGEQYWGIDCMHTNPECYLRHLSDQMPHIHSSLAVPLLSKGLVKGVMHLVRTERHMQPGIGARLVETFANEAAIAIESTHLYEETRTSLEMKSHLLQEMHHRVKNNLLSIAAILRMERRRTTSEETTRVLSESISRIDGMAATHDLLSRDEHIGMANIADIATKLIGVVSAYLVPPTLRVKFETRTKDVEVHSKKALVLA